ncbi:carbohydrate-binding protein [Streptomyces sp. NPDC059460]|uniref:carbohydrate-binding protein n=1 Tax=Streptomyces sp. NPDC059460 TaxID=3346840 RepID=UPI00369BF744
MRAPVHRFPYTCEQLIVPGGIEWAAGHKPGDSTGKSGYANIPVTAGNTAPKVTIDFPVSGKLIEFGDKIRTRSPSRIPKTARSTVPRSPSTRPWDTTTTSAHAPDGTLLATTPVPHTGGWDTYRPTPAVPVKELKGTHKLYLVFTSPQNNSFDVDAVDFRSP